MIEIFKRLRPKKVRSVALKEGQAIKLENFSIHQSKDGKIWIERFDGEGGQFCAKDFEDAITIFYEENF